MFPSATKLHIGTTLNMSAVILIDDYDYAAAAGTELLYNTQV